MMNDKDDEATFRRWIGIAYFAAISRNMRPSQSSATEVMRSGTIESFAQQNAAGTALPPIGQERDVDIGLADEKCVHGSFALLRSRVSYELEAATATCRIRKSSRKK